jgi:dihydrofolate reductase
MTLKDIPLVAVVAVARNGVIGRDNRLLWRLKSDLRRFRALTTGKPIIMGRKTFLSIGRPLPNRRNIIVTRDPAFQADGIETAPSIEAALDLGKAAARAMQADEIIIGGGGDIYRALIDRCAKAYVTLVDTEVEGDAHFRWPLGDGWIETRRETHRPDADNEFGYSFIDYKRAR